MEYQQSHSQQKSQLQEQTAASVAMEKMVESIAKSSEASGGGNFIAEITSALDEYASGKNSIAALDSQIASIPIPEIKERKGLAKFFYKLFGKDKKDQAAIQAAEDQRAELESQKSPFQEAMGDALGKFSTLMSSATQTNKKDMLNNGVLVRRVMAELPEANVKATMDSLVSEVEESHLPLLREMVEARFGVPVVDSSEESGANLPPRVKSYVYHTILQKNADGTETTSKAQPKDWSLTALKRVYEIYQLIPAAHLKEIKCLVHYNDNSYGGAAWGGTGVYYVNYKKGDEDREEYYDKRWNGGVNGHIDSVDDTRNGLKMLNMTIAHELGHIIDSAHNNWGYSRSESFRKWSGWVEIKKDPEQVVKFMEESLNDKPFKGELSEHEMALVYDISKSIVKDAPSWSTITSRVKTKIKEDALIPEEEKEALQDKLLNASIASNLIYHLYIGLGDNLSCYHHDVAMKGMKRPFHQGYTQDPWYTFDLSKWSNKISCYQYRCPEEEFAETYASYHVAPTATNSEGQAYKKGEKTPEGLRTWLEKEGLHKMEPENVSGSSPKSQEDQKMAS